MLSSLVLDLMNLLFRVTSKCILTTYKLTQFVSSLSTEGKMYNYFYFALNYTLAYFPRLLLTISIRPSNTAVLGDAENARHENARNAIVWNTACCICMSIAEQECMSRQERAPDFAANCVLVNAFSCLAFSVAPCESPISRHYPSVLSVCSDHSRHDTRQTFSVNSIGRGAKYANNVVSDRCQNHGV